MVEDYGFGRDERGFPVVDLRSKRKREIEAEREAERGVERAGTAAVYIVRHGQSHANLGHTLGAAAALEASVREHDSPLTDLGHEQAFELGRKLLDRLQRRCDDERGRDSVLLMSSPLTRAIQTSEGIRRGMHAQAASLPPHASMPCMSDTRIERCITEHCATEGDHGRNRDHQGDH